MYLTAIVRYATILVLCTTCIPAFISARSLRPPPGRSALRRRDELSGAGKRGLSYNDPPASIQNFNGAGTKASWAYNWNAGTGDSFPGYLEFVPMLWSDAPERTARWASDVAAAAAAAGGRARPTRHLLAFNEPDACAGGGSCISPAAAAAAYRAHLQPWAGTFRLGAPAVTNGPGGLAWLRDFLARCADCTIDFVPVHWYDSATNGVYFRAYLEQLHAAVGAPPLWITEFSAAGSVDEQARFMTEQFPWLDALPWVERYAWFWCDPSSQKGLLVDAAAAPTELGNVYAYS